MQALTKLPGQSDGETERRFSPVDQASFMLELTGAAAVADARNRCHDACLNGSEEDMIYWMDVVLALLDLRDAAANNSRSATHPYAGSAPT